MFFVFVVDIFFVAADTSPRLKQLLVTSITKRVETVMNQKLKYQSTTENRERTRPSAVRVNMVRHHIAYCVVGACPGYYVHVQSMLHSQYMYMHVANICMYIYMYMHILSFF